jgi:hypothetical protein
MLKNGEDFIGEIGRFSSSPVLGALPFNENVCVKKCLYGDIVEHFRKEINISKIMRKET